MKNILLLLTLVTLLCSSCMDATVERDMRRIGGVWEFESTNFRTNEEVFTGFSKGDRITFHDDYTLV